MAETDAFRNLADDKRERVLRAAAAEFADRSYNEASMNSLVREAGISKGSLFQYFKTKLDLFDRIVAAATGLAKSRLRDARDTTRGRPLAARLVAVMQTGFHFIDEHPHQARIYFRLLHGDDTPFKAARLQALHRQSLDFLHELLDEARQAGEIRRDVDLHQAAFLIHGIMQQLLTAYDTRHVDCGLGLYRAPARDVEAWITSATALITQGLASASGAATAKD
jgi:AcrR family transcriptional regulator